MWGQREKTASPSQEERPQRKPTLPTPWPETCSLQGCEEISFRWVWEHCSFHVVATVGPSPKFRVAEPQSWILVLPLGQVTSKERNTFLDSHLSWISSWHYFCILCIFLGELSDYQFFECASIRCQCIVESCNTGNISLSQQGFHSNRAEFIHLKRKSNI